VSVAPDPALVDVWVISGEVVAAVYCRMLGEIEIGDVPKMLPTVQLPGVAELHVTSPPEIGPKKATPPSLSRNCPFDPCASAAAGTGPKYATPPSLS